MKDVTVFYILQVHLCEAVDIAEYLQDDYGTSRNANRPVLVAVKMLRKDADARATYVCYSCYVEF